jgi:hypothetical protein
MLALSVTGAALAGSCDEDPEQPPVTQCEKAYLEKTDLDARNDYAYRVRLPVLQKDSADRSAGAEAIIDRNLRDVSKSTRRGAARRKAGTPPLPGGAAAGPTARVLERAE